MSSEMAVLLVTALVSGATDAFVTIAPNTSIVEILLGGNTMQDEFVPPGLPELYNLGGRTGR